MARPPTSWKNFERWVCKKFGGIRRGANVKQYASGKNDCIEVPGYSIEVKFQRQLGYQKILDACKQAEGSKDNENDIPIAVIKKVGESNANTIVCMRIDQFLDFFGSSNDGKQGN